jgi:cobalt-zinc-cadmium efflux system membrane fusion protein
MIRSPHRFHARSRAGAVVLATIASALAIGGCQHPEREVAEAAAPQGTAQAGGVRLSSAQLGAVRTAPVVRAPFTRAIEATGTVAFDQNRATAVLAPLSGPVSRLLADVGHRVHRGQPLAIVTSPDFAAQVSAWRKADSAARNLRSIADVDKKLFENDALSRRELEQSETDAVSAEADRDAATEQLRALGVDAKTMDDLHNHRAVQNPGGEIRSPLDGVVVERLVSPGQLLQAGATPCFTVADLSRVWVLANVFEADLPYVAVGDPAEVTVAGQAPIAGTVEYIAAIVDPTTRAVAVRLTVPNSGDVLKRDMYVRVAIRPRKQASGLLVPVSAVLRDEENLPYVFVAGEGGSFGRRRVQLGARSGEQQEITDGLRVGESVVVEGALFLQGMNAQ